jgi:uncharacterized protein (DUF433 family)
MTTAMDGLIAIDDRGEARIEGSRMKVKHLVLESRANGWGPRELQEQFPSLSLAQIHAALAYYHAHQIEMDAQIERDFRDVETMRQAAGESPFVKRMRAAGKLP